MDLNFWRNLSGLCAVLLLGIPAGCGSSSTGSSSDVSDSESGPFDSRNADGIYGVDHAGWDGYAADGSDPGDPDLPGVLPPDATLGPANLTDNGNGTVTDRKNGLMWQKKSTAAYGAQEAALKACQDMDLGGHSDWRLPAVDELRTLIQGCPGSMSDGGCEVRHGCGLDCWTDPCAGCEDWTGPGTEGCFEDPILEGNCSFYWTTSFVADKDHFVWGVAFYKAKVVARDTMEANPVRCVRRLN